MENLTNKEMSALQKLVDEQKTISIFLKEGIDLVIGRLHLHNYLTREELGQKWGNLSSEFLDFVSKGEIPPDDVIFREDHDSLDDFLQDALFIIGLCGGVLGLQREFEGPNKEGAEEYVDFLLESHGKKEYQVQLRGFSALTLAMRVPPGTLMLSRLFPTTDDDDINEQSWDLIADLNGGVIREHIDLKTRLSTTDK